MAGDICIPLKTLNNVENMPLLEIIVSFFLIIQGGDLDAKINELAKTKKHLEEKIILDWFVQLVLAVHYMHTRRVLHRDLKSRYQYNMIIKIYRMYN